MERSRPPRDLRAAHQARPLQYGRPMVPPLAAPAASRPAQPHPIHHSQPQSANPQSTGQQRTINLTLSLKPLHRLATRFWSYFDNTRKRIALFTMVAVILLAVIYPVIQPYLNHKAYALSPGESALLLKPSQSIGNLLTYDTKAQTYQFNQNYQPFNASSNAHGGGSFVKASIPEDASKGITLTDPVNQVDFTIKPQFDLGTGKQNENRIVFPAFNGGGHLVYTAGAIGIKQDVTVDHYISNTLKYKYQLELGNTYAAKLTPEGSIAIYGSSLPLNGNVSTGDAKDAALLQKARQKAVKDKLLFTLPAPKIIQTGTASQNNVQVHYELHGNELTVVAEHLKQASYPLSIDPTITATSSITNGNGLFSFDANIETNVYIDPSNGFFERSPLTGGNLLSWNTQTGTGGTNAGATSSAHFLGSAVVYAGTMYVIGGTATAGSTSNITSSTTYIEQAKIASDGSLGVFAKGNSAGLPAGGLSRFNVLTHNGYMYIIDGSTTDTTGSTVSNAVYYTRITSESYGTYSNGAQLKNWSTTTNKPSNALFDYGATVYNGYVYVAGGLANISGTITPQSAVLYAPLLPSGDIGTFSTATASLPSVRFGLDMQAYNGHLYVIGGNVNTVASPTWTSQSLYASIASDGSVADSSWKTGTNLVSSDGASNQVLEDYGSQFSMIYNGYLYVSGGWGCSVAAPTTTSSCSGTATMASYAQLAQLNADGSLGTFYPNDFQSGGTPTMQRAGTPATGYNGALYNVGGCSALNTSPVSCATNVTSSSYVAVNGTTTATTSTGVGDISSNRSPTALPTGLYGQASVVLNGYVYVLGGCLTTSCDGARAANYITYYAQINSDGSLGSWNNNTNSTNATSLGFDHQSTPLFGSADCSAGGTDYCGYAGLAATAYNGYIYVVGGYDGNNSNTTGYNGAVYYMQPTPSNGQTGTWTKSGTATIANPSADLGMLAYNGSLYVFGGCVVAGSGTKGIGCSTYYTQVQRSPLTANVPGAFTGVTGTPSEIQLSFGIATFGVAMSGNYIYLTGGADATNPQEKIIQRAKINASGDVVSVITNDNTGTWTNTTAVMAYNSTAGLWTARRRGLAQVVNGYLYVIGGHSAADTQGGANPNGTTYGDIEIGKIDMSSAGNGDIPGTYSTAPPTPDYELIRSNSGTITPRWNPALAFNNGTIYVTGGCTGGVNNYPPGNCQTDSTVDESFVTYNADSLGVNTWNAPPHYYSSNANGDTNLANRLGAGVAVYNGYIYVAGGCTSFTVSTLTCSATANDTAYAQIKADGTLGTWQSGGSFTTATGFGQLVALNGSLYYMGGQTGAITTPVTNTYYSQINSSTGAPGSWTATTQALPTALTQFSAVAYANRIFIAGGCTGTSSCTNQNAVYVSPALSNGGDITSAWSSTTAFTTGRRELALLSAGSYLYAIGGFDGTNYYADVQVAAPSTSTGLISSWTKVLEMPYQLGGLSGIGANGYVFVFGGRNGVTSTSCSNKTYFAAVNQNGTLGQWQQAPNVLTNARFGQGLGFSGGYFYAAGGDNCTSVISGSGTIEQSGQLSEAIHATYTRYIDFGTDATFRQFYVLGTNAQIAGVDIDKWRVIVKTATSANAATQGWGQKTTTTLTGLGTGPAYGSPITFQALNSSGVNQGAAEYWDVTFDIDQAQSFNFPDTSQPQITKYDLYFSPGPGKRLRDGKTFINEQQTNLDAHP